MPVSKDHQPLVAAWKIYLCLIVPITILLNLWFVNFHAPDDYDHLKRAYTLLHDPLRIVTPEGRSSGAMIDSGLSDYIDGQTPIVKFKRPLSRNDRLAYGRNDRIRWSGIQTFSEMPGAMSYFPLLYAPQAAMLELGRIAGASVEQSVLWARFANGFVGIGLVVLGLYLLPTGQSFVLLMLLLPRTLMQFASNSADPILYGLALIVLALGIRKGESGPLKASVVSASLFISATVRPPIAALALAPALQAVKERRWPNLALLTSACLASLLWFASTMPWITDLRCGSLGSITPKLRSFALEWPLLVGQTILDRAVYYYASFVGHYAWGNGPAGHLGIAMPSWIYVTAVPLLSFALWQDLVARASLSRFLRLSLAISAACSILLTFFAMYVACTVASDTIIGGVQGRYFVPPLFAVGLAIGGLASERAPSWPTIYIGSLVGWVVACVATMLINASQLYPSLH